MDHYDENLSAILGPTNTGKTHLAFEKFLTYSSGIFGFPLRLLARENYDKAVNKLGINKVALITGEEKIIPLNANYFFCTVEAMPIKKNVDCVIIDEVQLASDYERGHIFTDRILNCRGNHQTIFLGSLTIKSILIKLFPNIQIKELDRFSKLIFLPKQSFSKLKPRSAVIAFNVNQLYEIAETLRAHKGGAAVVLGSLSPRTRNAQVEVYENNKVDYLVATDAIGMGLNLNINNVCFSSLQKFDGRYNRNLLPTEIAQIAGRAGRYKNDGTFGYTKIAGSLDPLLIKSVENHDFAQIQKIYWRNSDINFHSIETILSSLKQFPIKDFFIHKKNAEDEINFRTLVVDEEIKNKLISSEYIELLWDVCRIPDFEKIFNDKYISFLKNIFLILCKNNFRIPEDWINSKISKLENFNGGISELSIKILQIRTWTYISNQYKWFENPTFWKERTKKIENELSDNLHIGLTNKFVDASSRYFINPSEIDASTNVEINSKNQVILDGKKYGIINGFNVRVNKNEISYSLFSHSHVKKTIRSMIEDKISNFLSAPDDSINLGNVNTKKQNEQTTIFWGEEPVGFLLKGSKIYSPSAEAINSEYLSSENKLLVSAKLQKWIDKEISSTLYPIREKLLENIDSQTRAIIFNCFENLGTYPNEQFRTYLNKISNDDKTYLSKLGIRIGARFFFTPNFMKKKSIELSATLWKIFNEYKSNNPLPLPLDGRVSFESKIKMPDSYWSSIGYISINNFSFRIDVFEKIFFIARQKIKFGPFLESSELMNPIGCNNIQLKSILDYCGYDSVDLSDEKKLFFLKQKKNHMKKTIIKKKKVKNNDKKTNKNTLRAPDPNSPFAVLEKLL